MVNPVTVVNATDLNVTIITHTASKIEGSETLPRLVGTIVGSDQAIAVFGESVS